MIKLFALLSLLAFTSALPTHPIPKREFKPAIMGNPGMITMELQHDAGVILQSAMAVKTANDDRAGSKINVPPIMFGNNGTSKIFGGLVNALYEKNGAMVQGHVESLTVMLTSAQMGQVGGICRFSLKPGKPPKLQTKSVEYSIKGMDWGEGAKVIEPVEGKGDEAVMLICYKGQQGK